MKGAIVTGANGFIGSHVVTCLLQQGIPVAALCHDGKCDHLPQSDLLTVYPYDLLKQSEVVNTLPPPSETFATMYFIILHGKGQPGHCGQILRCNCRMRSGLLKH